MPYCTKCGVELDEKARACPLCGTKLIIDSETETLETREEAREGGRRHPLFAVEVMSVVAGLAAFLCVGIDLWSSKGSMSWSLYCLVGIAMAWLVAAMPIIFRKKPWLNIAVLGPGELLLLFLVNCIEILQGGRWWFLSYGLPIYLFSLAVIAGVFALAFIPRVKGLNIMGIILAGAAIEALGLEIILSFAIGRPFDLHWSPIVALACIPASGLAFYFHYRVVKKPLHRQFHL